MFIIFVPLSCFFYCNWIDQNPRVQYPTMDRVILNLSKKTLKDKIILNFEQILFSAWHSYCYFYFYRIMTYFYWIMTYFYRIMTYFYRIMTYFYRIMTYFYRIMIYFNSLKIMSLNCNAKKEEERKKKEKKYNKK
jgi:hypothetical protein